MMRTAYGLFLLTIIAVLVTSCSVQPSLTANQQHFVDEVRSAGLTGPSYGSDQQLITVGNQVCNLLGTGVTASQMAQQAGETLKGMKETDAIIIETDAALDLCPKYKNEIPTG